MFSFSSQVSENIPSKCHFVGEKNHFSTCNNVPTHPPWLTHSHTHIDSTVHAPALTHPAMHLPAPTLSRILDLGLTDRKGNSAMTLLPGGVSPESPRQHFDYGHWMWIAMTSSAPSVVKCPAKAIVCCVMNVFVVAAVYECSHLKLQGHCRSVVLYPLFRPSCSLFIHLS